MKTARIIVIVVVAACGGTAKPGSSGKSQDDPDGRDRAMSHMGGDHQMKNMGDKHEAETDMPPQVAKFHDTLAPRWHAEHGPQRMADTCAAIPQFHADAEAISGAEPPSKGDAGAWSKGGKKLTETVAALDATCRSKDAEAFEAAFERVHEAFHGVMEAGGGHDEHGKDEKAEPGKDDKAQHHH
jgi:hypothetical protein